MFESRDIIDDNTKSNIYRGTQYNLGVIMAF